MNTALYKKIRQFAMQLVTLAQANNVIEFDKIYAELAKLCIENEMTDKNHPTQWETLADFTDDSVEAISIYLKALKYAETMNENEHIASICYALADRYVELNEIATALNYAHKAKVLAASINDPILKEEIDTLIKNNVVPS